MNQESKHHVILVPGLGDGNILLNLITFNWSLNGFASEIHLAPWERTKEPFEDKLKRLEDQIDSYKDEKVSLVGISAGGSLVLNAFMNRPKVVSNVITVCAPVRVILGKREIGDRYLDENPALRASLERCEKKLEGLSAEERKRIMTISSTYDQVVPDKAPPVEGASNLKVPGFDHRLAITTAFILKNRTMIEFLKG